MDIFICNGYRLFISLDAMDIDYVFQSTWLLCRVYLTAMHPGIKGFQLRIKFIQVHSGLEW